MLESVTISRRDFDAAIFDLDGVLTDTAGIHAVAWKSVFDTFLQRWAQERGLPFQPFDIETDYLNYVDGRPRYDGIRTFLAARGITLPEGLEDDAASTIIWTSASTALTRRLLGYLANRILHFIWKPHAASGSSRLLRSCSRTRWRRSKPAKGVASNAW